MLKRKIDLWLCIIVFFSLILCFLVGYLVAIWGITEIVESLSIEHLIVEINESKIIDAAYKKLEMQGRI